MIPRRSRPASRSPAPTPAPSFEPALGAPRLSSRSVTLPTLQGLYLGLPVRYEAGTLYIAGHAVRTRKP